MTISESLSLYVEPRIQRRGLQYFRDNRVSLLHCHGTAAEALVSGGEIYRVRLVRDGELLRVSCSCPFFQDRDQPCKHVWAAILAADEKYGLRGGNGSFPQRLVSDTAETPEPITRSKPPGHTWREILDLISGPARTASRDPAEVVYVIDAHQSRKAQQIALEIWLARRRLDGTLGARQHIQLARADIPDLPDPADRRLLSLLAGAEEANPYLRRTYLRGGRETVSMQSLLPESVADLLLPILCATGRCRLRKDPESDDLGEPLVWDEGAPWELWLELRDKAPHGWELHGSLRRDGKCLSLTEPDILLAELVFTEGRVGPVEADDAGWIPLLSRAGALPVPAAELEELLERLFASPRIPRLDLPEPLRAQEARPAPQPLLRLLAPYPGSSRPRAELFFLYEGHELAAGAAPGAVYEREERRLILRDLDAEAAALDRLRRLGFRSDDDSMGIHPSRVPRVVDTLLAEGWLVEAQGKLHRPLLELEPVVSSGIAWFELRADARFAGASAGLQQILAALKRKTLFVPLGDGSVGVLPKEWLRKLSLLTALGAIEGDRLIVSGARTALLDAWLDDHPRALWDDAFDRARERLRSFECLAEAEAPPGFLGELRGYQRAGLGWLLFLRDLGFGGCLADDMGLGKTIQVLALLESRRTLRRRKRLPPSLVIVPKSLIFNWLSEAARFTPKLRVLDYTGTDRRESEAPFAGCDVVLTTYGTLRRDVEVLEQVEFDSLILDEAQAIKNADSQTARAVRLLRGSHRLALSGTPVENHLGELWSLMAFLNPGLTEASPLLSRHAGELRDPSPEARDLLARALRPFFLRRTKEQVAPELPRRQEQTLVVELPPKQRRLYDELRDRFHQTFVKRIAEQGLGGRTKILFLEALLRLRQAACHPGLLDPRRADEPCAKLDLLLPQLQEILAEGHKALVFSQFTTFLGLLRRQLDREGIPYLYLDGRTRDRQEKVDLFQSDPAFPLFLISLKAGGLGLNLTAADYVYLLDPWWNPAVEAQAIDRAHRIGQTRPVFASRIVAKDTVEEKILELQKSKRDLADAIIQADKSLLAALSREDLELLLS